MEEKKPTNVIPRFEYFVINGTLLLIFFSWRIFTATGALESVVFWYSFLSALGFFILFIQPREGDPQLEGSLFSFDHSYSCKAPAKFHHPTSEEELVQIVKNGLSAKKRLKVIGGLHSSNAIAFTGGEVVVLDKLNRIQKIEEGSVTVDAGITFKVLQEELWDKGYSLGVNPFYPNETVGGALQTAALGGSLAFEGLASLVTQVKGVDGNGEVFVASPSSQPELFKARVGLGALAIITSVSLKIEKSYFVSFVDEPIPSFSSEVAKLEELFKKSEYVVLTTSPGSNGGRRSTWTKQTSSGSSNFLLSVLGILKTLPVRVLVTLAFQIGASLQLAFPQIIKFFSALPSGSSSGPAHKAFNPLFFTRQSEVEFFVELSKASECFSALQRHLLDKKYNSLISLKFAKKDETTFLSPSVGRDSVVFTVTICYKDDNARKEIVSSLDSFFQQFGGRPSWGKHHLHSSDEFATLYPSFKEFVELRKKLDPNGIFLNKYLERSLIPDESS